MASTSAAKVVSLIFQVLCALIGLVLIAFGVYVLCSYETNKLGTIAAYAYIGVGVGALVVLLFGCIGAIRENVCCTVTFIILVYVVILGQVVIVFFLTRGREPVSSNLSNTLDDAWEEELSSPGAMSLYENWFGCCGRASPQDYIVNNRLPPTTCFKNGDISTPDNLITIGCRVKFEDYWLFLLTIFNVLSWILIGLELIGSFVSCCLCNRIRNDRRRQYF